MSIEEEKRSHKRFIAQIPAIIKSKNERISLLLDISPGGCSFITNDLYKKGEIIEIRFQLFEYYPVQISATVMWSNLVSNVKIFGSKTGVRWEPIDGTTINEIYLRFDEMFTNS